MKKRKSKKCIPVMITVDPDNHTFVRENKLHFSDMARVGIKITRQDLYHKKREKQFEIEFERYKPKILLKLEQQKLPYDEKKFDHVKRMIGFRYTIGELNEDTALPTFFQQYKKCVTQKNESFLAIPGKDGNQHVK